MAEWLCSGLQSRGRRFDSDLSLQIVFETTERLPRFPAVSLRLSTAVLPGIRAFHTLPLLDAGKDSYALTGPVFVTYSGGLIRTRLIRPNQNCVFETR